MSPHRTAREHRAISKAPSSPARSSVSARKHTSKACENCRKRRTKCTGGIPCDGCKKASLEDQCQVRIKARPQRPLSSRHSLGRTYDEVAFEVSGPCVGDTPVGVEYGSTNDIAFLFDTTPSTNLVSINDRQHALAQIEEDLTVWCNNNGIESTPLIFKDHSRISTLPAAPLPQPPILAAFEDALMSHLITSMEFEQHGRELRTIDRPRLLSLYGRYRAVPDSLTEDQRALIYASLCLARHTQISQADRQDGSVEHDSPSREDVTYYRMAYDLLRAWGRPSIYSVWALFCLVPYSTALGGPAESTDLLSQMGWQVQQLGLHRITSAQWYAPEDMVQVMFSAYLYMDILRASITDLQTFVPLADIEVEASPPQTFVPANLCQASRDAMAFMVATSDPGTDTTSDHFVAGCERQWGSALIDLRQEKAHGIPKAKSGWATIRYHWMRILLHYPRISMRNSLSSVVVARSVTQILHTYSSLASLGYLNPSWPQLRRITVCGQLLLLLCASGEMSTLECSHLLKTMVELLDGHAALWPIVTSIKATYAQAAVVLGLHYPDSSTDTATGLSTEPITNAVEEQGDQSDMGWQNLSLMFDPAYFLSMTHEDL